MGLGYIFLAFAVFMVQTFKTENCPPGVYAAQADRDELIERLSTSESQITGLMNKVALSSQELQD